MISHTEENYLKAIFILSELDGSAGANELSKYLSIKMPTVTNMVKRLAEKKFVQYESYKPMKLTPLGRKEAIQVIRKHRLTEMYLVEKMGFGWEEVHEIAEQVEHIRSPAFFEKMDALLGFPKVDPHGSPIPDEDGVMVTETLIRLLDVPAGQDVIFMAVSNSSTSFLNFLNTRNLSLGSVISVESKEEFDGSMIVTYNCRKSELSSKVCEKLLVKLQ